MYCILCDNSGIYEKPNNEELYSDRFDKYDKQGVFNHGECRNKALRDAGYEKLPCSCNKGKYLSSLIKYKDEVNNLINVSYNLIDTLNNSNLSDADEKIKDMKSWLGNTEKIKEAVDKDLKEIFKYNR